MVAQLDTNYIRTRPLRAVARLATHILLQGRPLTTGWRWLNPIILAQFSLVKRLPQLKQVEKPIFILGTGRSGSTILGKILSIHPHVLFLNEAKAMWHATYPEEDLIGSYSHGLAYYQLDVSHVTPAVRQALHRLYGYGLALTGSRRVLDKHGEITFRIPFIQNIFPDAKFVFLVRNGGDTIRSIATWSQQYSQQIGGEIHDWWGVDRRKWDLLVRDVVARDPDLADKSIEIAAFTRQEDMAAVEWITAMRQGLHLMQSIPGQIYQVRYEDLIAQPEHILKDLLAFCELPEDITMLRYAQRILVPALPKKPITPSPVIGRIFFETMKALNYPVDKQT